MDKLTKLNAYGEAILIDPSRSGSIDDALYKLYKYEVACDGVEALKSEYEWLLELNDDNLTDQVKQTNNVQNALIELLRLVDYIMDVQI